MGVSTSHSRIALTGADCFLRAFDAETRRTNGAGHLAQLVLRLGRGFSIEEFRKLVGEIVAANPIVRAPIRRRGFLGPPQYRLDRAVAGHTVAVVEHRIDVRPEGGPPQVFLERLNGELSPRRGRLLAFDVAAYADGRTDLAMTWLHLLMDGWGSERFVEHMTRCSFDPHRDRALTIDPAAPTFAPKRNGEPYTLRDRAGMARSWHDALNGAVKRTTASPAGPLRPVRQRLEYEWTELSTRDSATVVARCERIAGVVTPMLFYLAAAVRGHQAVARHRGRMPESWVVPLPVNLRAKSAPDETFRTLVSLIWFHATPAEADDFANLLEVLSVRRRNAIRDGTIQNGIAAMQFVGLVPARLFTHLARRTFGGELCSFFFAYTGEFATAADSLCGAAIEHGIHAPSVPASPGSSILVGLRGGRLSLTQIRQRGALDDHEMRIMRDSILADLTGR